MRLSTSSSRALYWLHVQLLWHWQGRIIALMANSAVPHGCIASVDILCIFDAYTQSCIYVYICMRGRRPWL